MMNKEEKKQMNKNILGITGAIIGVMLYVMPALANVAVAPSTVRAGVIQTFNLGVSNEKDNPTVGIRLLIPQELTEVTPNVKPGWTISIKSADDSADVKVTEISWVGGSIPSNQRDDFIFNAQIPINETSLPWKVYQTYQNGDIVSWDKENAGSNDAENNTYSITKVVNEEANTAAEDIAQKNELSFDKVWQGLTMASLVLSVVSIGMHLRKRV